MPRPRRGRLEKAVEQNAACEECHPGEAAQWRASHHQQSHLNPAYQRAFAVEPLAFCRGCHAPEGDPFQEPSGAVAALGVGCVTCHLTDSGEVLAAPEEPGREEHQAPHPLRRSAAFLGPEGCAGCHEFRFPERGAGEDDSFMQTTVREHRRSPAAERSCGSCHLRDRSGHRSHAFAQVRDPSWMRDQIRVVAGREGDVLRLVLEQVDPGHGFPSGDLFRRIEVVAELRDARGKLLGRDARYLARHFDVVPGRPGRTHTMDNRVFFEPRAVELSFGAQGAGKVSWWVRYQRVATVGTGAAPGRAAVESEMLLHAGVLPWPSP